MIKLEHVVLASPEQMEFIIEGMRNPMNSWEKSDSYAGHEYMGTGNEYFKLGENDHSLMRRLANIYKSRRGHKLDEWRDFCKWIESLPYNELICKSTEE